MTKKISVYILAGGKSERMGTDKGLSIIHHKAAVAHIIEVFEKINLSTVVVTANEDYKIFNKKIIHDCYSNKGPAAGIDAALHDAETEHILVTGCDMPFVDSRSVELLISLSEKHEITLIKNKQKIEPLFAVYKKTIAGEWRKFLLQDTYKLSDFFVHFDTNFVEAELFLEQNPYLFFNMNTPEELALANKMKQQ